MLCDTNIISVVGFRGVPGATPNLTATAETGNPGTPVEVERGGTNASPVLHFTIPGSAQVSVGAVTTLNPGAQATVVDGDPNPFNVELNFGIPRGEPGLNGTGAVVNTVADLRNAPTNGTVTTLGCLSAGDGGGGFWRWDAASTDIDNIGTVVLPTGLVGAGRWVRVYEGPVNAMWFGAYRNLASPTTQQQTQTTAAIQAAIDWSLYRHKNYQLASSNLAKESIYIPAGYYVINDTIQLSYGDSFKSVHIYGDGDMFQAERGNFSGTGILANFSDRPAIAVSGARTTTIKRMGIKGLNFDWISGQGFGNALFPTTKPNLAYSRSGSTVTVTEANHNRVTGRVMYVVGDANIASGSYTVTETTSSTWSFTTTASGDVTGTLSARWDDTVASSWLAPTLSATAGDRYTPYAGIAIDPYALQNLYPTRSFPSWLGYSTQSASKSSYIVTEDVSLSGFVVGLVSHPNGSDGNGDFIKMNRTNIYACQYGISVCQTQARGVRYNDGVMSLQYCCFTTTTHGKQNGKPHFHATSCEFSFGIYIAIAKNTSYGAGLLFEGCYGETLYKVGDFRSSSILQGAVQFIGCEFSFDSWPYRGAPDAAIATTGSVNFRGCVFSVADQTSVMIPTFGPVVYDDCAVKLDSTVSYSLNNLSWLDTLTQSYPKAKNALKQAFNGTRGIAWSTPPRADILCSAYNLSTGVALASSMNTMSGTVGLAARRACTPAFPVAILARPGVNQEGMHRITLSAGSTLVSIGGGRVHTLTLTNEMQSWEFVHRGGAVGDYVWDAKRGLHFVVIERSGLVLTLFALNSYNVNGLMVSSGVANSGLNTLDFYNCRRFSVTPAPNGVTARPFCTTTSGNATLSSIRAPNGDAITANWFLSVSPALLATGDYVYSDPNVIYHCDPANGYVTGMPSGSNPMTVTLNTNFVKTVSDMEMPLFIRPDVTA